MNRLLQAAEEIRYVMNHTVMSEHYREELHEIVNLLCLYSIFIYQEMEKPDNVIPFKGGTK